MCNLLLACLLMNLLSGLTPPLERWCTWFCLLNQEYKLTVECERKKGITSSRCRLRRGLGTLGVRLAPQVVRTWVYLVVVVWRQQGVDSSHCLQADLLVWRQVKDASWQLWQILKVHHMLCLHPSAPHNP